MERRSILPVEVFEFRCDDVLLREAVECTRRLSWIENDANQTSRQKLNARPEFEPLHAWFATCIESVRCALALPFERLVLTQSWANRTGPGQHHHGHTHPNSYMSGILYLTTSSNGATEFYRRNPWFEFFLINIDEDRQYVITARQPPVAGTLLLFPSSLEHRVEVHEDQEPRLSISFNVFPEGRFDARRGSLRFLHLTVTPFTGDDG